MADKPTPASQKAIMLVDDSITLVRTVADILRTSGFHVETALNAESALEQLATGVKVDLLITDLNMPGMNGIELIQKVRALQHYRFIPILFLTTESQQSRRVEAKAAGASGWLVKPVTGEDLLKTIAMVLR